MIKSVSRYVVLYRSYLHYEIIHFWFMLQYIFVCIQAINNDHEFMIKNDVHDADPSENDASR